MMAIHTFKKLFTISLVLFFCTAIAEPQNIDNKLKSCLACHGLSGLSTNPLQPNLDGQNASYLIGQLIAFSDGSRQHAKSDSLETPLNKQEMIDLAAIFAQRKFKSTTRNNVPTLIGTSKYNTCIGCHGVSGEGLGKYPRLKGLQSAYISKQLKDYQTKKRLNQTMQVISQTLSDQEISELATYISAL